MYHIEGTGLRTKAFIPPRVPVHDFYSGKEPPTSEWQPERYPFENDTEFLDIDEEEIAPEPGEPEPLPVLGRPRDCLVRALQTEIHSSYLVDLDLFCKYHAPQQFLNDLSSNYHKQCQFVQIYL
jgi:hypothetical protein